MKKNHQKSFADRCLLHYEINGKKRSWAISAVPGVTDDESLKHHLSKWMPEASYLGHEFSPDKMSTFEEELVKQGKLTVKPLRRNKRS